jgi:PQQ-dependent dehydrogenase (methanol/ethanol family)
MSGRALLGTVGVALMAALADPTTALAQGPGDGAYTQAQADRGRRIFGAFCATCHGVDLEGAVGPTLAGPGFTAKWSRPDRSVRDLYDIMRTTMPRPAAGSLSETSYLEVLAYVLSRNGLAVGERELAASTAALGRLHIPPAQAAVRPPAPEFIPGDSGFTPTGPGPTQAELAHAGESTDWLYHTHDYAGTRYAPLRQITPANAGRLQVHCAFQVGSVETFVTGPLVWQGTMYLTTARLTIALDATTCRERWRHTWEPQDEFLWANNRGVAIKDGYLVRGTADGYLLAIDAATGRLLWARQVARPAAGETITMPPLVFEDMVIIGPAGSENNVQGWIGAFRLKDGTQVWRFNTIPRPGEPGAETWRNAPGVPVGGGGVWTAPSLDVARGELHVAVGNPAPDLPAELRPGTNLYTNSLIVLDVRTGALRWHAQLVPSDFHDWDLTQATPLIRVRAGDRTRDAIVTVGKDGILRALDRQTHERLYQTPVTTQTNVDVPLTREGVRVCPGILGGVEWNGPAHHPGTGLLFTVAVDRCTTFSRWDSVRWAPGEMYLGGGYALDSTSQGWLTAVDASTGKVRWRYHSELPMVAAVTTTAGGLVVTGENTGDFLALDAATGRELYRFNTGGGMGGGIISYGVKGRQYIAAASGRSGFWFGSTGAPTLFIFALPSGAG